jgi:hypothetical protein
MICGLEGSTQACHSNQLRHGKGKGIKAHDWAIASLCYKCHHEIDQGNKLTKEQRRDMWQDAHEDTIAMLFERGWLTVETYPY